MWLFQYCIVLLPDLYNPALMRLPLSFARRVLLHFYLLYYMSISVQLTITNLFTVLYEHLCTINNHNFINCII